LQEEVQWCSAGAICGGGISKSNQDPRWSTGQGHPRLHQSMTNSMANSFQFNRHADVKTTDLYQKLNFCTGLQNYEQISKLEFSQYKP
jgi:hypothetical protein